MQKLNDILSSIDNHIGGSEWFVLLLLGVGVFFTIYLKFPQIRYFGHAIDVVKGKFDKKGDEGDTSHFQALTTALSGTVGTGNIAGVAFAIHLGGPAALFWMLVTAMLGMTTKFVEVLLSHKYREKDADGRIAGGPMYFMRARLNINLKNGKVIKTGVILGAFFAFATILSSFGTGSLPQINSISNALFTTFGINKILTGAVLAVILGAVIIGGIKRIAKVTEKLVPAMALIYFVGAIAVILFNIENVIPSFISIFADIFTGSAATGGFLGATIAFAFNRGVNRGLFSNEAGQGSAPIAHAAARAHEPVSEGMVAILEPFIDTIIICMLTGMVLLSSGVWNEKVRNEFQYSDTEVLTMRYDENNNKEVLFNHLNGVQKLETLTGEITVVDGYIQESLTILHSRSVADNVKIFENNKPYSGKLKINKGRFANTSKKIKIEGNSLIHSAPLTTEAFKKSYFGDFGQYIVAIGLLLFAFSTAISWSYYGDRAVTYLFGSKAVIYYHIIYVVAFFFAAFSDTTIIWTLSGITIAFMTLPNLIGLLILRKEIKLTIKDYWILMNSEHPDKKLPNK